MKTIPSARFGFWAHRMQARGPFSGFTLIELMVTIAIAAILLALAAPSFKTTIQRWRVNSARQAFAASLYMARRAAIKHGGAVVMHRRAPTDDCPHVTQARHWSCGWDICIDTNGDGQCTAPSKPPKPTDDVPLQSVAHLRATNIVLSANVSRLKFGPWGHPNGLGALGVTFSPADKVSGNGTTSTLCMSSGGRIRFVAKTSCSQTKR